MWGGGSDLPNFWLSSRPRLLKKMLLDTGLVSLTMLPCLPPPLPLLPRFDSWILLPRVVCRKRGLRHCTRSHLRTRASSSRSRGRREPVGFRAALSSCQRLSEAVHVNTPTRARRQQRRAVSIGYPGSREPVLKEATVSSLQ